MTGTARSYLDYAVLPPLRRKFLSPQAALLLSDDLRQVLWANAAGARLIAGATVAQAISQPLSPGQPLVRQLHAAVRQLHNGEPLVRGLKIARGLHTDLIRCRLDMLDLGDGASAIQLETDDKRFIELMGETERAELAVASLADFADAVAVIDGYGLAIAASEGFAELELGQAEMDSLIAEAASQPHRLVKRAFEFSGVLSAVGIARLQDRPPRFLFVSLRIDPEEFGVGSSAAAEDGPDFSTEADDDTQLFRGGGRGGRNRCRNFEAVSHPDTVASVASVVESKAAAAAAQEHSDASDMAETAEPDIGQTASRQAGPDREGAPAAPIVTADPAPAARGDKFRFAAPATPVRFAFVIDRDQVFRSVSPELAATVGPNAADVVGRSWSEVARVFGFDLYGDIAKLLTKRDTWSGKSVMWPIQGEELVAPVDLAALPSFDASRQFAGFRGFGIIRAGDAVGDPNRIGLALAGGTGTAQAQHRESEAIEQRRLAGTDEPQGGAGGSAKVVSLAARKRGENGDALNRNESQAFSEIARTLSNDNAAGAAGQPARADAKRNFASRHKSPPLATTAILSQVPVPVLIYRNGETLYANAALLRLSGYDTIEALSAAGGINALLSDGRPDPDSDLRATLHCRDGSKFEIAPILKSVPWEGGKALLFAFAEPPPAGARKEPPALELTRASELQHILDTASDGIIVVAADGTIESINASGEALFGRGGDISGRVNLFDLFAVESHRALRDYMAEVGQPGVPGLINDGREVIGKEAQGGLIPLFLTVGRMGSTGKYCIVLRDMTQWKKTEEELVKARRAAEAASEQKSEFLARVSHEIRTPLNAIIGFSDVMIEERFGPVGNDRYREYLRDIHRSGVHVLDLINDLLDISKIEAGKLDLHYEAVDLNQIAAETVALLQPQANRERIIIRTSFSRAVPKVVADMRSIRQIILNLVSNAIKFTPENGQVIVSTVYEGNGEVALRIRDTGRGMSAEEIDRAMKPFQQVGAISDRRGKGTGLGLPLTKALVEANRAYFDLESTPGEGTIAHIHFPSQRVLAD